MQTREEKLEYSREYTKKNKENKSNYNKEYRIKNIDKLTEYDKEYTIKNKEKKAANNRKRYLKNREKRIEEAKEYYLKNKEKVKERDLKYCLKNKEKISATKKEYRKKNDERIRKYRLEHKEKWTKYNKEYEKNRLATDSLFKLKKNLRSLIRVSHINCGYIKKSKTEDILGCTFEELKLHLESKFEPWMNWKNYGNWNGCPKEINVAWDIDHIIPLSSTTNVEELIKLCHYTNLQPLCSYTNRYIKKNLVNFTK